MSMSRLLSAARAIENFKMTHVNTYDASIYTLNPYGMFLKPDGTVMWLQDYDGEIHQFTLGTAFDLSTISYDVTGDWGIDTATSQTGFRNLHVTGGGQKAFSCADTTTIYEYAISSPWDIGASGANLSYVQSVSFTGGTSGTEYGLWVDDASVHRGMTSGKIDQFDIALSDDITSTRTLDLTYDLATIGYPSFQDLFFSSDENTAYITDYSNKFIHRIGLKNNQSKQKDFATAFYRGSFDVSSFGANGPLSFWTDTNEQHAYVSTYNEGKVFQFTIDS